MDGLSIMELDTESNFEVKLNNVNQNIEIILRLRDETDVTMDERNQWIVDHQNNTIEYPLKQNKKGKLEFNKIVDAWSQRDFYNICFKKHINQCFDGLNFSLMAYGPSKTGKTHTTLGSEELILEILQLTEKGGILTDETQKQYGMFPRAVIDVFDQITKYKNSKSKWLSATKWEFEVELSIIEVYNEKIINLLGKYQDEGEKQINFSKTAKIVQTPKDTIRLIGQGLKKAHIDKKDKNSIQFKGHIIYSLNIVQINIEDKSKKTGRLTFVDLASYDSTALSSFDSKKTQRVSNNQVMLSLYQLDQVVNSLKNDKSKVIPYQNSKLTRCLTDVIGGNSKTICVFFCSRKAVNQDLSIKTLKFASNIQKVKNKQKTNLITLQDQQLEEEAKYNQLMFQIEEKLKMKEDKDKCATTITSSNKSFSLNISRYSQVSPYKTGSRDLNKKKLAGSVIENTKFPNRDTQTPRTTNRNGSFKNDFKQKYIDLQFEFENYKLKQVKENKELKAKVFSLQNSKILIEKELLDLKKEFKIKEQLLQKKIDSIEKSKKEEIQQERTKIQILEQEIKNNNQQIAVKFLTNFDHDKCVQEIREIMKVHQSIDNFQKLMESGTPRVHSMETLLNNLNVINEQINKLKSQFVQSDMLKEPISIYNKIIEISHMKEEELINHVKFLSQENTVVTIFNRELIQLFHDQQINQDKGNVNNDAQKMDGLEEIQKYQEVQRSLQESESSMIQEENQIEQIASSRQNSPKKDNDLMDQIRASWKLFERLGSLGRGAFGDVLKIRCLKSTRIYKDTSSRILMNANEERKAKTARQMAEEAAGRNATVLIDKQKSMFQDEFYVAKTINVAHLDEKSQCEALNEIASMQAFNSPYIVSYYDSFIDEESSEPQIIIIIEYCPNGDLSNFLEKQFMMSLSQPGLKYLNEFTVWRIFINICLGLEHMHSKNFIHRDLKTLNVFMTKDNVAKIGDLGCAINIIWHQNELEKKQLIKEQKRLVNDEKTRDLEHNENQQQKFRQFGIDDQNGPDEEDTHVDETKRSRSTNILYSKDSKSSYSSQNPVGTPYYLAPEIWKEKKYSKESDIWALGVILYELLHFKKPFPASEKEELINKVCNLPYDKIRKDVSRPLHYLISIMLKKDPHKRPSIEEIIMNDDFQNAASKLKINLPLMLNKQKILQKIATDQHGDLILTPYQQTLFDKEIKQAAQFVKKVEKKITVSKTLTNNANNKKHQQNHKGMSKIRKQQEKYGQFVLENSRNKYSKGQKNHTNSMQTITSTAAHHTTSQSRIVPSSSSQTKRVPSSSSQTKKGAHSSSQPRNVTIVPGTRQSSGNKRAQPLNLEQIKAQSSEADLLVINEVSSKKTTNMKRNDFFSPRETATVSFMKQKVSPFKRSNFNPCKSDHQFFTPRNQTKNIKAPVLSYQKNRNSIISKQKFPLTQRGIINIVDESKQNSRSPPPKINLVQSKQQQPQPSGSTNEQQQMMNHPFYKKTMTNNYFSAESEKGKQNQKS